MEPLNRKRESWGMVALICGIAPIPLTVMSMVPFVGCLVSPLTLLAIPCAIGFGLAGVMQARKSTEPNTNAIFAWAGIVLGIAWMGLIAVGVVMFLKKGGFESMFGPHGLNH